MLFYLTIYGLIQALNIYARLNDATNTNVYRYRFPCIFLLHTSVTRHNNVDLNHFLTTVNSPNFMASLIAQ